MVKEPIGLSEGERWAFMAGRLVAHLQFAVDRLQASQLLAHESATAIVIDGANEIIAEYRKMTE